MKRLLVASFAVTLIVGAIALSSGQRPFTGGVQVAVEDRNPWTHLRLNDEPETFHFVVVSDRTGGHRAEIFSRAVEQINLLQPAFVLSVGDLIEGYTKDKARLDAEWKEFASYTNKLQMPFFYVAGNHDIANPVQDKVWAERFGRRYYHFLYRDVLFIALCADDRPEDQSKLEGRLGKEQIAYVQKVLRENPSPRWTVVSVHKPLWAQANLDTNGWLDVEQALQGRKYTVFAGHVHRYQKYVRHGMNYYQLATTGGVSKLRGVPQGEFDHVTWVTMKKDGPIVANILLEGVYPEDMRRPSTDEEGMQRKNLRPTRPVAGRVTLDGQPVPNALVTFYLTDAKDAQRATRLADAWTESDGTYRLSTYAAYDGAPEGMYKVTVVRREPFFEPSGKLGPNRLPETFASPKTTPLAGRVTGGENVIDLNLAKK